MTHAGRAKPYTRLAAEQSRRSDLFDELVAGLKESLRYTVTARVECNGNKCREGNCLSCCDEDSVDEFISNANNFYAKASCLIARATQGEQHE